MSARLVGRTGKALGIEQPVSELLTLGSGPGNGLRIDSRTLSRQHAQIVKSGSEYYLEDLGSRNGTFLNGQRVKRFPIRNLDVITLGPDVDLIFLESGAPVTTVPRAQALNATIVWMDGPLEGRVDRVHPDVGVVLGRASGLEGLGAISRRHAAITLRGDRVTVEDLGSANGTLVNGTPITAVTPLSDGDEISLGGLVRVRLSIQGAATSAADPVPEDAPETIVFRYEDLVANRPLDVPRQGTPPPPVPGPPPVRPTPPPVVPPTPVVTAPVAKPPVVSAPVVSTPPAPPPQEDAGTVMAPREPMIAPRADPSARPTPVVRPPAPAEVEGGTIMAPREPMIAPRADPSGTRPKPAPRPPAPAEEEGGTVMAPREAAVAPRVAPPGPPPVPPVSSDPGTFGGSREAGALVPDGLAARARAARRPPDETFAAPPAAAPIPSAVPAPPPAAAADVSGNANPLTGVILTKGSTRVALNLGVFEIGRNPEAAVVVDSRDISRRHARLHVREDEVVLEDFQTVNGSFVNDVPVNGRAAVPDGSRVRFATVEYEVMYVRSRGQQT